MSSSFMGFINDFELKEVKEKRINKIKIRKIEMESEVEEKRETDYTMKMNEKETNGLNI